MSHHLTLELPHEVYEPLVTAAGRSGQTPAQWAANQLRAHLPVSGDLSAALQRLLRHAGAVDLGHPTGADNESIDCDLAAECANTHEEAS